ncbi:MAG: serine/threonine-protein kinase [Chloroflexota bacterium]
MDDLIGQTIGQYQVVEKIGKGGMAHVYKAYQPSLERLVAIKVLSPTLAEEPGFTERFHRESLAIARLNHPNILAVYDSGLHDNKYNYLVMRYIPNSLTLAKLIKEGAPTDTFIKYIIQISEALQYSHDQGIIHRDIKPANILVEDKWALLTDFGLVKELGVDSNLTETGMGLGTPAYMSPEQAHGLKLDGRADIYALGIILYRVLSGSVPHEAPTPMARVIKRATEPVPPLRQIAPNVSTGLEQVTMRALASIDTRYSSAAQFGAELEQAFKDPSYQTVPSFPAVSPGPGKDLVPVEDPIHQAEAELVTDSYVEAAATPAKKSSINYTWIGIGVGLLLLLVIGFMALPFFDPSSNNPAIPGVIQQVSPTNIEQGDRNILVTVTLVGEPVPPDDIQPVRMTIGPVVSKAIQRDGLTVTGTFDFPENSPPGSHTLSVEFPIRGNDTVVFFQTDAFEIIED